MSFLFLRTDEFEVQHALRTAFPLSSLDRHDEESSSGRIQNCEGIIQQFRWARGREASKGRRKYARNLPGGGREIKRSESFRRFAGFRASPTVRLTFSAVVVAIELHRRTFSDLVSIYLSLDVLPITGASDGARSSASGAGEMDQTSEFP